MQGTKSKGTTIKYRRDGRLDRFRFPGWVESKAGAGGPGGIFPPWWWVGPLGTLPAGPPGSLHGVGPELLGKTDPPSGNRFMRRSLTVALGLLLAAPLILFAEDKKPDLSVGKPAPEVISQDLNGKKVKLSDLRGKVVVLDIWATWCGPCKKLIPHYREMVKKYKDKPFVLVGVSIDAKKETLVKFMDKEPMPWTHWWNGTGGIAKDWDIEAIPTIYVLDAKGIIRSKVVGADEEAIEKAVAKLIKETPDKK
jgi:thiol-disulfide isomerase/thioredoxin